jgi:hypothetical protein
MIYFCVLGPTIALAATFGCCWLGWQLLRQNGRLLLRLEELEKHLDELEFGESDGVGDDVRSLANDGDQSLPRTFLPSEALDATAATERAGSAPAEQRANRFKNHSLVRSKLKRDGLKPGTPAPDFSCLAWMAAAS